jgi:hypothetical protein
MDKERCVVEATGWDPVKTGGTLAGAKDLFDPAPYFVYRAIMCGQRDFRLLITSLRAQTDTATTLATPPRTSTAFLKRGPR